MICRISKPNRELKGTVTLNGSKSESNRVLIILPLARETFPIENISNAKDTEVLLHAIMVSMKEAGTSIHTSTELNIGQAGTAMRFMTAFLAALPGSKEVLTGSERMKQRPIGILVDALRYLGASIEYLEKDGYPPLKMEGKKLRGGKLEIDGSVSSQYISALLLIAPTLENGLELHLKGNVTSAPYIKMTLGVMERCGINYSWKGNVISIAQQEYVREQPYPTEADWSAASYYYSMAAVADEVDLEIRGLRKHSLQGDSVLADLYVMFGVRTEFIAGGIRLTKGKTLTEEFAFDFTHCPDIAQTAAVTAAALGIPAQLNGLHTLKIKETDRIIALKNELEKLGVNAEATNNSLTIASCESLGFSNKAIETYDDHRMAMSFAPLALMNEISINDPDVVEKSYPGFWDDLRSLGFVIEKV